MEKTQKKECRCGCGKPATFESNGDQFAVNSCRQRFYRATIKAARDGDQAALAVVSARGWDLQANITGSGASGAFVHRATIDTATTPSGLKSAPSVPPYFAQDGEVDLLTTAIGATINACLTGPTGCGKTHLVQFVAQTLGRELFTIQGGAGATYERIIAKETLVEENGVTITKRQDGILPTAMKRGAIVYLDEPNAIPSEVLFYLFSAMDHRRSITFDDGTTLEAAPDFVVLSAMNEGHGYAGTALLNHAFRARSIVIDMSYLPQVREQKLIEARTKVAADIAKKLTEAAATLRASKDLRTPIGTRSLIDCATLIGLGVAPEKAAQVAIVNQVPSQFANERKSVQDVLAAFFGGKIS